MILPNSRKKDLKDSLVAISKLRKEVITYSVTMALYDMTRRNFVSIEMFEVVFKESILHKHMYLSKERISSIFVLISEAYYVLGDFQSALESSNEAIDWNPGNAMAYNSHSH
jgi:hypothetical protein